MTEERARRKLSGILSADAVGCSRLMQEDEAWTILNLSNSKELMANLIQQYRGRVVDAPGDNLLAEFASVVDATECAVKIQQALKAKNAELQDNRKMEFRIGINLGDVVEEADRIYGDGVNIAARLEGLAAPGGICISRTAYDHVKNKLELGYEYMGEQTVKNIVEPVRVYRVLMEPEAAGRVIGERRFIGRFSRRTAMAVIISLLIVAGGVISWNIYLHQSKKTEPASRTTKSQAHFQLKLTAASGCSCSLFCRCRRRVDAKFVPDCVMEQVHVPVPSQSAQSRFDLPLHRLVPRPQPQRDQRQDRR